MYTSQTDIFDQAVSRYFAPLAANVNLPLHQLIDGVYEIRGKDFTLRIRRHTGHIRGILITIVSTAMIASDTNDLCNEIGLGNVAEYGGESIAEFLPDSDSEYLQSACVLASETNKYLIPYLEGYRSDFAELKKYVDDRTKEAMRDMQHYRFPSFVKKKWR
ncbi:MAG: hypothetical protein AB7Q00_05425 [Phycisphaerales bacterium]